MDILQDEEYRMVNDDSITHMATMPEACVDASFFSPPFPQTFAYTDKVSDIGNSENLAGDAKLHLSFFLRQLLRIVKPGRVVVIHVAQIHRLKRSGEEGVFDFRGLVIRLAIRAGFIFDYDWVVRKNPQMQALRTKKWELKFQGLETDRARSRGAMPDYLIKLRVPGDNKVPIQEEGQVSRNDWIEWAECCWTDIRETDTLNVRGTKGEGDVKHIAPLQLSVIERLVRLYSNTGEIVFSPFAGIGSEGHVALKNNRRFYGVELKPEYYDTALRNLERAKVERDADKRTLFDAEVAV